MPRRPRLAFASILLVTPLAAQNLVVPNGYATTEANANNLYPWNRGAQSMRIQFVYDSSHFTAQGITAPVVVRGVKYRPDAAATTVSWAGGTWPNVRIDLATAALDYLAVSTTFAANLGPDASTVHQGPVTVQPGSGQGTGVPLPWYIDIPFTQPFPYDPTGGNDLVVDIHLDGTGWSGTSRNADHASTTASPPALASRIYDIGGITGATGTVGLNYGAVCEFDLVPAIGLYPAFQASPVAGTSPLVVQFTDTSYSSAAGGVVAWQWDFDDDGTVDSVARNPQHTYTTCGDFSVRLTVVDANGSQSLLRTNLVTTDHIRADFSVAPVGGGVFQFTDLTTPAALQWAWDFTGDGIPDSNAQNPTWNLGTECSATVTLTATRNCRTSTRSRTLLLAPASLSSNSPSTTGTTSATDVGNFFDVQVLAPEGILVCGLTGHTYTGVGAYTASVYVTPDTYLNKDTLADQWRLVATGQSFMNGGTTAAPSINEVPLDAPFYLPAGNYGIAVYHRAATGSAYIGYTSAVNGPYANGDLVIHPLPATAPGVSRTALFGGSRFGPPRPWCGTFHYTKVTLTNQGGYGVFGLGCAGSLGVARLTANGHPAAGSTLSVTVDALPLSATIVMTGFSRTSSLFGPLPLDLGAFGAPGCRGLVSPDATLFVLGTGNQAVWNFGIPGVPSVLGIQMYQQALVLDPATNALGGVVSDAAGFTIGL